MMRLLDKIIFMDPYLVDVLFGVMDHRDLLTHYHKNPDFLMTLFSHLSKTGITINPLQRRQILDSSKLKEFAEDNFKFNENGRMLSKWVENTVGKGEIACHEQFLLFPQCFQKACFPGASKGVIVWEWVKSYVYFMVCNML